MLLMIPTFFGTTILVFFILQSVPSGPFEQAVLQIKMAKMQSGEGQTQTSSNEDGSMELSEEVLKKLRMQYGLDKSIWTRYLIWLGIAKKEIAGLKKKLSNENFTSRAPAEVVEENRKRLTDYEQNRDKLLDALGRLEGL